MNQEYAAKIGQDKAQDPREVLPGYQQYKDPVDGMSTDRTIAYMPLAEEQTPFKITGGGVAQ